jgi:hypothetical protein
MLKQRAIFKLFWVPEATYLFSFVPLPANQSKVNGTLSNKVCNICLNCHLLGIPINVSETPSFEEVY